MTPGSVFFDMRDVSSLPILVVDDKDSYANFLFFSLKEAGYSNIDIVKDLQLGVEQLKQKQYQVLLILSATAQDNYSSLIKSIRSEYKELSIIAISSAKDIATIFECLELGVDDYLVKPARTQSLHNLFVSVWRKKSLLLNTESNSSANSNSNNKQIHFENGESLEDLQNKFAVSLEIPISIVTQAFSCIMTKTQENISPDTEQVIKYIIKELKKSSVYCPVFCKYIVENDLQVDPMIKRWFNEEEAQKEINWSLENNPHTEMLPTLSFDVWSVKTDEELVPLLYFMYLDLGLIESFSIPEEKLKNFLIAVKNSYRYNYYHNFRHAFDVTQHVYYCLRSTGAREKLKTLDLFGLLLAAITHDIDHPGVNNTFLTLTGAALAIRYNDISPLENFHCAYTWNLLSNDDTNILEGLSPSQRADIRKIVISCILTSDPVRTMELLTKFKNAKENYDIENVENRLVVAQFILKCSDISNPVRLFNVARVWAERIREEFFRQGDREKQLNLAISVGMDRVNPDPLPKFQIGFIDFLVLPLFLQLAEFLPGNPWLEVLASNRSTWNSLLQSETQSK